MSWQKVVEISKYCPAAVDVTDTAPDVTAGFWSGVPIPEGWHTRALELGGGGSYWDWHTRDQAADFARSTDEMAEAADWWLQWAPHLLELIHVGRLVKDGQVLQYTSAWGHADHVHVAADDAGCDAILAQLAVMFPGGPPRYAVPEDCAVVFIRH